MLDILNNNSSKHFSVNHGSGTTLNTKNIVSFNPPNNPVRQVTLASMQSTKIIKKQTIPYICINHW